MLRKVLLTVVGHVDHGKSSILDKIRGTTIVEREAGAITQAIGASIIPIETIKRVCGDLLEKLKLEITIPGFLAIDTPGHAAFTNLRRRGGSLADIAVVVVDVNEGMMPQTIEAIEILKAHKTPFIIAANKIDVLPGWMDKKRGLFEQINAQGESTKTELDNKLYELVGDLYERFQLNAERFDRVEDHTKQLAIVPVSARTGVGIAELLMVITGLAQRFLGEKLQTDIGGDAKGTVLEVKETKGLGKTLDVILYDGSIAVNDIIIIGGVDAPIVTKVKALFEPSPLAEMRDTKAKFQAVKEARAATGVRITAKEIGGVIAGMPVVSCKDSAKLEEIKKQVQAEVKEVLIETEEEGILVKADSLGSLEAMKTLLDEAGVAIRKAAVGDISKRDIAFAKTLMEESPYHGVILGFNIKLSEGVEPGDITIITNDVIYKTIEDLKQWQEEIKKKIERKALEGLVKPAKIEILRGYVFRQNNPAIVGVQILQGTLGTKAPLMKREGVVLTEVKAIQKEQENVSSASKGEEVAVSLPGVTVGRQIEEGDVLITAIPEEHFKKYKEFKELLESDEKAILKEVADIMRGKNPVWGV